MSSGKLNNGFQDFPDAGKRRNANSKFTKEDRMRLATFEGLDFVPSHSKVYQAWLKKTGSSLHSDWDYWLMMGLTGIGTGVTGFLTYQTIKLLTRLKWAFVLPYIQDSNYMLTWSYVFGISAVMMIVSSLSVLFVCPTSSASGLPEVIALLNGAAINNVFNLRTFLGVTISFILTVAAGMFCGPEGPMIILGAIVGSSFSQLESDIFRFRLPIQRFRNLADRSKFIMAGAGAGLASVFRAPVGGLLFTIEEVAFSGDIRLAWQTFFCCMMAAFTTDILTSAFEGYVYQGHFGIFQAAKSIVFWVNNFEDMSILAFIPAVIIGIIGGLLGSAFVFLNINLNKFRRKMFGKIKNVYIKKFCQLMEVQIILLLTLTVTIYVPSFFPCTSADNYELPTLINESMQLNTSDVIIDKNTFYLFNCPKGLSWKGPNGEIFSNRTINQVAALLVENGRNGITYLFNRDFPELFGYPALFIGLASYFFFSCWAAGSALAGGLVVPMLYTGALYGRIVGMSTISIFGIPTDRYGAWINPGLFATIGAASYMSGVTRITISLTVLMIEVTNDVQALLPITVAVMVAQRVGDMLTEPFYSAALKLKCVPILPEDPKVKINKNDLNLELFTAGNVMKRHPRTVHLRESVVCLARLLQDTPHSAFPVIHKPDQDHHEVFVGTITRMELCKLLQSERIFESEDLKSDVYINQLSYEEISTERLSKLATTNQVINKYISDPKYEDVFINLEPYINQSATTVHNGFSLHRTYRIFRKLGLRHLTVVDKKNQVVGIITRKDLMEFNLEEMLEPSVCQPKSDTELMFLMSMPHESSHDI
ncbi:chloride channel protein C-like [Polypterus senegalus]|nr:chloride channel protein C-like [Polypterus senegalus]